MDSLQILIVASPFANMTALYEVDPSADVLLIVPPFTNTPSTPSNNPNGAQVRPTTRALRLKVSSKHLTLASKPFKNKLHLKSTTTVQSDGRTHISLAPGFDPKAVAIAMNAVHGRGSKVPRTVDLDTLGRIAYFVDKFQMVEAMEVYADRWIGGLWDGKLVGGADEREVVSWVYVSYVFRRGDIFREATRAAAVGAAGRIGGGGLPVREGIIKHIDLQRQELVGKALEILHRTFDDLRDGKAVCEKHHCDSFLLGDLIKTLHRSGQQIWAQPTKPFVGASFREIVKSIHESGCHLDRVRGGSDLWSDGGKVANGLGNRKRKSPVQAPITPDSSPELGSRTSYNGIKFDTHECDARRLVGKLDEIEALEDGVAGLDLESSLGYQLY